MKLCTMIVTVVPTVCEKKSKVTMKEVNFQQHFSPNHSVGLDYCLNQMPAFGHFVVAQNVVNDCSECIPHFGASSY
jgi:hypothetical protein